MGIPSYFSYIVHNHIRILKRLNKANVGINNVYIDSNSIIYDSIYEIIKKCSLNEKDEKN